MLALKTEMGGTIGYIVFWIVFIQKCAFNKAHIKMHYILRAMGHPSSCRSIFIAAICCVIYYTTFRSFCVPVKWWFFNDSLLKLLLSVTVVTDSIMKNRKICRNMPTVVRVNLIVTFCNARSFFIWNCIFI